MELNNKMISKYMLAREVQRKIFEQEAISSGCDFDLIEDFNRAFANYRASEVRKLEVGQVAEIAGNYFIWKVQYEGK